MLLSVKRHDDLMLEIGKLYTEVISVDATVLPLP